MRYRFDRITFSAVASELLPLPSQESEESMPTSSKAYQGHGIKQTIRQLATNTTMQISVGLMWGFSAVLTKVLTLQHGIDIFLLSSIRSLIGVLFLLPLVFINWNPGEHLPTGAEKIKNTKIQWKLQGVKLLGAASTTTNVLLLLWAFQHTAALTPIFFHYSGLLLLAPASHFFLRYRPTRREWLVVGLTLVGLAALFGVSIENPQLIFVYVAIALSNLVGSLCIGWLSKTDERLLHETGARYSHGAQCFIICDLMSVFGGFAISATTSSSLSHLDASSLGLLILLGVFTWGIPNFFALLAMRMKELVSVALLWLCDPVFVALWPVVWGFDRVPSLTALSGAGIILIALALQRTG
jgi:drug/metabolite transporter (DMT)-like permease